MAQNQPSFKICLLIYTAGCLLRSYRSIVLNELNKLAATMERWLMWGTNVRFIFHHFCQQQFSGSPSQ